MIGDKDMDLWAYEREQWENGLSALCGVDEAGAGPLAGSLLGLLNERYPQNLQERYKLALPPETPGWQLLEQGARRRGMLVSGGEADTERMARVVLDEFRSGKLGRFTLELPEDIRP